MYTCTPLPLLISHMITTNSHTNDNVQVECEFRDLGKQCIYTLNDTVKFLTSRRTEHDKFLSSS